MAMKGSTASASSSAQNVHVGHSGERSPISADATRPPAMPISDTATGR